MKNKLKVGTCYFIHFKKRAFNVYDFVYLGEYISKNQEVKGMHKFSVRMLTEVTLGYVEENGELNECGRLEGLIYND